MVVGPSNYAPEQKSVRTMYDLLYDVFVRDGRLDFPTRVSFQRHILPILQRLTNLQWVNKGFAAAFGWKSPYDFSQPEFLSILARRDADPANDQHAQLRRQIYMAFRDFDRDGPSPVPWPWLYGDAMNVPPAKTPREHSSLAETQLQMLLQWAVGDFISDYSPQSVGPVDLDDVPLASQPAVLDQAALSHCFAVIPPRL